MRHQGTDQHSTIGRPSDTVQCNLTIGSSVLLGSRNNEAVSRAGSRISCVLRGSLRHRQVGILVTTSVVGKQAYAEIRQDHHPAAFLCGRELDVILMEMGLNSAQRVRACFHLRNRLPANGRSPV